ncbi:Dyp-type peroxidase [Microbacterium sp.]|uniref:Dyp-type peroxidase n=1 Tax=Microbacterium sp. TaxID=51671 RepID=UPI0039E3C092
MAEAAASGGVSRRTLLTGGAGLIAGAAAASGVLAALGRDDAAADVQRVSPYGAHQAGIAAPAAAQAHALISVFDASDVTRETLPTLLASLGTAVAALTAEGYTSRLLPDGAGDLTVVVGIGPRLLALIDPDLAPVATLPVFASDDTVEVHGGDVLVIAAATDPTVPAAATEALTGALAPRWAQPGLRGAGRRSAARNPLGYYDGIIVPDTTALLDAGVWIGDGPLAGGTVCTVRRFRLDIPRFRALDAEAQDAVFGRRQTDGTPLSGGDAFGEIDLTAKSPEGEYLVPARAHARAAHPSFIGAPLMLRRSYSYANDDDDRGVVFLSFQNDVSTFSRTLQRLEETDDLLGFATATASGAFAVLPGFTADRPLGSPLDPASATADP